VGISVRFDCCPCGADLSLTRRGVLQGGGAGFVSALALFMIGAGRTARADPLAAVPTVDRLTVRMVVDNGLTPFTPPGPLDGLKIKRAGLDTAPDRPPRRALQAEWGLAMHAQSGRGDETRNVLVDFGYTPETLLNNLSILGVDPARIDALVLSHGHFDHYGGMTGFLTAYKDQLKKGLPLFLGGEDCFCAREGLDGGQFGALDRDAIADAGLTLMMAEGPALVADHAFATGRIPLVSGETPLKPTREKIGVSGRFGCFADRMPADKATGASFLTISSTRLQRSTR
jgi:7,8-dihydropterin-6-yl-methyl-4-(beta-D-ribofuranosyl)aminobenzene 5'-phosphate synthase